MKALIKVGYGCNEHCIFCHSVDLRHLDGDEAEIHRKIRRAKELGHTMVVLSGGEVTIRPELLRWAAHVASLDLDLGLVTNGRLLAYDDALEKLVAQRLRYVYLSLHGGTARVHDAMVRTTAFDDVLRAIRNVHSRSAIELTVNCVVTRQNVEHLRELVDVLLPFERLVLKFSMVQPKGGAEKLLEQLVPRVAHVAERVRDAIAHGDAQVRASGAAGPTFTHDGIPLCLLPGLEARFDDLRTDGFSSMVEVGEPDFFPVDDHDKTQPEPTCAGCPSRGPCPGLYRAYVDAFGASELRPPPARPRSNSFHYVLETLVATDAAPGFCPLRDGSEGVTPWDRVRHLLVRHGGRIARYRTETRDFADVELERIKHTLGQVYVDVSRKAAVDDFSRDLVQLARSELCAGCVAEPTCTGMFEPRLEDVFGRDDAAVRTILSTLTGRVLDVGCGEGPYDDVLAPRAEAGAIDWVGLEPDPAACARLRQRRAWGEIRQGCAEEASLASRSFDHVLVLRSWNHFADPAAALARLLPALRPGGTLTVVDNVAFALARTRPQARLAERSPAVFEHHRNDDAAAASRCIEGAAAVASERMTSVTLRRLERRDVDPRTSNQWLLRYELGLVDD
jgi:MoaA/NifB/PqqE/SkfB family radical SAM enzyme/SAM-dependent methyltransferase